jgi:hypothetical protein
MRLLKPKTLLKCLAKIVTVNTGATKRERERELEKEGET